MSSGGHARGGGTGEREAPLECRTCPVRRAIGSKNATPEQAQSGSGASLCLRADAHAKVIVCTRCGSSLEHLHGGGGGLVCDHHAGAVPQQPGDALREQVRGHGRIDGAEGVVQQDDVGLAVGRPGQ